MAKSFQLNDILLFPMVSGVLNYISNAHFKKELRPAYGTVIMSVMVLGLILNV